MAGPGANVRCHENGRLIAKACDRRNGLTPEPGQTVLTVPAGPCRVTVSAGLRAGEREGGRQRPYGGFLGLPCSCSSRVPSPLLPTGTISRSLCLEAVTEGGPLWLRRARHGSSWYSLRTSIQRSSADSSR